MNYQWRTWKTKTLGRFRSPSAVSVVPWKLRHAEGQVPKGIGSLGMQMDGLVRGTAGREKDGLKSRCSSKSSDPGQGSQAVTWELWGGQLKGVQRDLETWLSPTPLHSPQFPSVCFSTQSWSRIHRLEMFENSWSGPFGRPRLPTRRAKQL